MGREVNTFVNKRPVHAVHGDCTHGYAKEAVSHTEKVGLRLPNGIGMEVAASVHWELHRQTPLKNRYYEKDIQYWGVFSNHSRYG